MENKKISPCQIPFLVRLTADVFDMASQEISSIGATKYKAAHMHFVVDLLSDLVGIAYPDNSSNVGMDALIDDLNLKPINEAVIKDIEKDFQNIAKIMKDYKPPKAGEF